MRAGSLGTSLTRDLTELPVRRVYMVKNFSDLSRDTETSVGLRLSEPGAIVWKLKVDIGTGRIVAGTRRAGAGRKRPGRAKAKTWRTQAAARNAVGRGEPVRPPALSDSDSELEVPSPSRTGSSGPAGRP